MENFNTTSGSKSSSDLKEKKKYVFFIDQKKFETDKSHLTVREILTDFARVNTANNTLAVKEHGNFRELKNLDESIALKEGVHFTIFNNEVTPVS
jgi:hypothetical protein